MLRLSLLGAAVVERDGVPVAFDTRKATALLAVLGVESAPQPRDRLAALFWPEADATRARSALRRTLSVTAAAVGPALVIDRATIRLDPTEVRVDVLEFDRLVGAGDATGAAAAVALCRDDFLAGFTLRDAPEFHDWRDAIADRCRRRLAQALSVLVDADSAAGDYDSALAHAQRWLSIDPLHEPAHHALIRIHAWRGDRSAAMRQYRTCVRVLDAELGVPPLDETTHLYEAVRRNELPPPPPPPTPSAEAVVAPPPQAAALPRLIGRRQEAETLRSLLADLASGAGRVAAVSGPTGIGKTTLLDLVEPLLPGSAVVVRLRCHPEETTLAYCVAIEMCRALITAAPQAAATLAPHARIELARLLPEVGQLDHALRPSDDAAAITRLYGAVRELFLAAGVPVAISVDDAHWLDAASAELLAFLIRRIDTAPLAVVLAWSTEATSTPPVIGRAALDAVADGRGVHLALTALTADDLADVTSDGAIGLDRSDIMLRTGGDPTLVAAYVAAAASGDDPAAATSRTVRQTGLDRVRALSQTAQQVLAAAAVLGGRIDPDVLRETSGRGDVETVTSIEAALAEGLMVETAAHDGYEFRHETFRELLLEQTTVARRRLLHERAAAALSRHIGGRRPTSAEAGAVAQHLHAAGDLAQAADWHWRAATEARALHAHDDALIAVHEALSCGLDVATGRLAEGELLITLGRYADAIGALELAAAALDAAADDVHARSLVERRLADVHHRLGDYDAADAHLEAALALANDDSDRAAIAAERALVAYRRGGATTDAVALADDAVTLARGADDDTVAARALNVRGMVAAREGDAIAAEKLFRSSAECAVADTDNAVAALNNLSRLLERVGKRAEALSTAREALQRGARLGDRHRVAALHTNVADLLRANGQDEAAMEHLKTAAALFAGVDDAHERRPEIWTLVEW